MKSGLKGRNNVVVKHDGPTTFFKVSMKSGLEDRNNRVN